MYMYFHFHCFIVDIIIYIYSTLYGLRNRTYQQTTQYTRWTISNALAGHTTIHTYAHTMCTHTDMYAYRHTDIHTYMYIIVT